MEVLILSVEVRRIQSENKQKQCFRLPEVGSLWVSLKLNLVDAAFLCV